MDIPKLVKTYVRIRDKRSAIKREYEEKDNKLKEQLAVIADALGSHAKENGLDTMKTEFGTVSRTMKTRYWPADWDAFNTYMDDFGGAAQFMVKQLNQSHIKQFLEENPEAKPPINSDSEYAISVRRSN